MQLDPILWTFLVSFQDAKGTFVLIEFAELLLGHSLQQELYPSPMKGCKIQDGLSTSRLNMSETGRMNVSKSWWLVNPPTRISWVLRWWFPPKLAQINLIKVDVQLAQGIGMLRAAVQSWDPECWRPSPWGLAIYWLPTSEKYPKPSSDSTSPWRIWTPKAWSLTIAAKQSVNEANNFIKGNLLPLQEKSLFPVSTAENGVSCDITMILPSTFKHKALIDFTKPTLQLQCSLQWWRSTTQNGSNVDLMEWTGDWFGIFFVNGR